MISRVGRTLCTVNSATAGLSTSSSRDLHERADLEPSGRVFVTTVLPGATLPPPPFPCQATSGWLPAPGRFGPTTAAATAASTAMRRITAPAP